MKNQTQESRTKNQVLRKCLFSLGAWFLILGSLSAHSAERIVSLNACTDELLLQLAHPDQIAGVTHFQHSPISEKKLMEYPQIARIPGDVEKILALHPSLVLAGIFSNALLLEQLRKAGIPVTLIKTPANWEELIQAGKEVARTAAPSGSLGRLEKNIAEIKKLGASSKWQGKTAVFWSAAGHVSGRGTFEDTILKTLGLQNIIEFKGYGFLSLEKLIQLKPDVVVVTQRKKRKDSWSHDMLFHPALQTALPNLEYIEIPETAASCASIYSAESLMQVLQDAA